MKKSNTNRQNGQHPVTARHVAFVLDKSGSMQPLATQNEHDYTDSDQDPPASRLAQGSRPPGPPFQRQNLRDLLSDQPEKR